MKVLYISNKPVYPAVDGGCVAMQNFLNCMLHAGIEVKHLFLHTSKHPYSEGNYPSSVSDKIQPEGVFIDTAINPARALGNLFKQGSYNVNRFFSTRMVELIEQTLLKGEFDCVILESLFVTPYLDVIRSGFGGNVFIRTHNVESNIWKTLSDNCSNPAKRIYLKKLYKDLSRYEMETLNKVDGILAISSDDLDEFRKLGIDTTGKLIPVAISLGKKIKTAANQFFHLGAMDWQPNIEAVQRLTHLFPTIRQQLPNAELHIAGGKSTEVIEQNAENGIFVHGFVEDLNEFVEAHGILVSPIISGSGIRIKILEMMALGIPVVTTKLGAQGISYQANNCLITVDTDADIAKACIQLSNSPEDCEQLGIRAQDYIRKNHNIETISKQILEFLNTK